MLHEFYGIFLVGIITIIQYLPILGSRKFILLIISSIIASPVLFLNFSFENPEIWILVVTPSIAYINYLGYKHSKYIESMIILYVNQQILESNNFVISISEIIKLVDKDLEELSIITNKEKYIKSTIEVLKKNNTLLPTIQIII